MFFKVSGRSGENVEYPATRYIKKTQGVTTKRGEPQILRLDFKVKLEELEIWKFVWKFVVFLSF